MRGDSVVISISGSIRTSHLSRQNRAMRSRPTVERRLFQRLAEPLNCEDCYS